MPQFSVLKVVFKHSYLCTEAYPRIGFEEWEGDGIVYLAFVAYHVKLFNMKAIST